MKLTCKCGVAIAVLVLASCASVENRPDSMCSEVAAFANATRDSSTHIVELKTDWGGQFETKEPNTFVMAAKHCIASGYGPGEKLCDFLLQNTSTEFPEINLNRALSCFGAKKPSSNSSIEYVALKIWSYSAIGVRENVRVGVEFAPGTDKAPPTLKLLAERLEEP